MHKQYTNTTPWSLSSLLQEEWSVYERRLLILLIESVRLKIVRPRSSGIYPITPNRNNN